MTAPFTAAAIARRDGSDADGIHLLWTAPPGAGYSVDGWDIRRRKATDKPRAECYELSQAELEVLHRQLRLRAPFGEIAVRDAACPTFPTLPPDEPHGDDGEPPRRTCVGLDELTPGAGPNPRKEQGLALEVRDFTGAPAPATRVHTSGGMTGLDCGFETVIMLPAPASAVEITLVHFSRPAEAEAFDADGTSAGSARMTARPGQPETLKLAGPALASVVVRAPQDEALLLEVCVTVRKRVRAASGDAASKDGLPSALPRVAPLQARAAARIAIAPSAATGETRCVAYDIRLLEGHRVVEVNVGVPAALVIAMRAGKAVDTRVLTDPSGMQSARIEGRDVDEVLVYATALATVLRVCADDPPDPEKDEQQWQGEALIAKGIQIPVRALDPALGSQGDEDDLAKSRLLPGETFDAAAFHDVAELMNAAAADADDVAPVWMTAVTREDAKDPLVELRSWPYALALLVDAPWRRMLGFGFLDGGEGLTPGDAYDYRITGRFRRRDVEERLHGFHAVPRGTTLPKAFALGPIALRTPTPATVELRPPVQATALGATGRKGIALTGNPCLTITFAEPVTSVVLELAAGSNLSWKATTTDFLPGLPINAFGGPLPSDRRVTIETADPVDTITLSGSGFLFGIREVLSPSGTKPDDVVERSVVLTGVVFEDTPAPDPPLFLGTLNLQQPTLPADPAAGPPQPPASLGFRLSWLPPPPSGAAGPVPWAPDVAAFPPFDVLGFDVERRRVDTGGAFEELDGAGVRTLVFGSRSGQRDPPALVHGIDLEAAFADDPPPTPPVPVFMTLDDVIVTPAHAGPPPGSLHQYRIFSIDAIGRRSATPRLGSVVRLEKRQPPPKPVGPPDAPSGGALAPAGVRARVLQAADPDLPPADRTLLGASTNAVVLEWGWTQVERDRDPHATEFRVYWQPLAPDVVSGQLSGAATLVGGAYEIAATLDRPLAADAMKGRYLAAPDYPFKVASHTAGQTITVRLEPSVLDPARTPGAADVQFRPTLTGSEQRPQPWAERSAVVPIAAAESYQHVFRDLLTLDADHPRARVWAGVSAADDQPYIADALPATATNGGRPGNESAIVAAAAAARYLGQPTFVVPAPLPDVPEHVTDEPAGEAVTVTLDLPALLPSVSIPAGHRVVLERVGLDAVVACVSARADGQIGATLPDGITQSYTLANAADQAAFLTQIRTGTPGRVEGRFLMDFLLRFAAPLAPLWQAALPAPVTFGTLSDALPNKAERYVHRIRLADAAGHVSAGSAVVPQIVRVPSLRSPSPPQLAVPSSQTDALAVQARVRDAFDLSWVVLFTTSADADAPSDGELSAPAQLLRIPNRRDLYPNDGIRVRLADGTLLAPAGVLAASAGAVEVPDRVVTGTLTPGHDRRVALWGIAATRDGVPSRLAGPIVALTGPTPLVTPTLTVARAGSIDTAQWTPLTVAAQLALERSTDGGTTWSQVTPWLASGVTTYSLPAASGTVRYRAILRGDRARTATGAAVTPS